MAPPAPPSRLPRGKLLLLGLFFLLLLAAALTAVAGLAEEPPTVLAQSLWENASEARALTS